MYNTGKIKIYKKTDKKSNTGMALVDELEYVQDAYYGELGFLTEEYYAAMQSNVKIAKRIRIRKHPHLDIDSRYVIEIQGKKYAVGRTYSKQADYMDITLVMYN